MDEAKRKVNLRKHGLDFWAAYLVYENPGKVTSRLKSKPEDRFSDVALVELKGAILALAYTIHKRNV